MPKGVRWPPEEEARLLTLAAQGLSAREIAAAMGKTRAEVENKRLRLRSAMPKSAAAEAPPAESMVREGKGDTEYLCSQSSTIRTLDDLLAYAEVDLNVWEVERYTVNRWEMGAKIGGKGAEKLVTQPLYQVKAWLKRNRKAAVTLDIGARILSQIAEVSPVWSTPPAVVRSIRDRHLFEVCTMDLHVGKLAWAPEAGEDYDSDIAESVFRDALETLIQQAGGYGVERVLFPVGNDLLQIDNLERTTTSGTPQDTDTRFARIFARAESITRHAILRLSEIAPVVVPIVPGNHDRQSAFTLGRVLAAWFHDNPRVTVDTGPKLRKYHRYGVNLIGYTHGSEEKPADLPLIMAQECPQDWAETRFREWHVGHIHKMKETRHTAGDSFNGVRVRIIPALCSADAWHYARGFVGEIRSAEAYMWHRETGYAGHFSANVLGQAA